MMMKTWMNFVAIVIVTFFLALGEKAYAEQSVQTLIDNAQAGSIVQLENKTYEGPIVISKPITLKGTEGTKIVSDEDGIIVQNVRDVQIDSVQIEAKKIPLFVTKSENIHVSNMNIRLHNEGVKISDSSQLFISNLQVLGTKEGHFSEKPNGLNIFTSKAVELDGVHVENVQDGIYFETVDGASVKNSYGAKGRYGVHFMYSDNIEITNSHMENNITGFAIMVVKNAKVSGNIVEKQLSLNSNGMYLYDAENVQINNNLVKENTIGLLWNKIRTVSIAGNTFQSNGTVFQSVQAIDVSVSGNEFFGNILTARSDNNGFLLTNNYYDDYEGYDLDDDGFGDTVYQSFTTFGQWMVRKPVYQYYVESPSVVLINSLDRKLGVSEDGLLVDEHPVVESPQQNEKHEPNLIQTVFGIFLTALVIFAWRKMQ